MPQNSTHLWPVFCIFCLPSSLQFFHLLPQTCWLLFYLAQRDVLRTGFKLDKLINGHQFLNWLVCFRLYKVKWSRLDTRPNGLKSWLKCHYCLKNFLSEQAPTKTQLCVLLIINRYTLTRVKNPPTLN